MYFLFSFSCSTWHEMDSINTANIEFCLDVFKELNSNNTGENIFFSPLSLLYALSMILLGARGNSAQQMEKVWKECWGSPQPELLQMLPRVVWLLISLHKEIYVILWKLKHIWAWNWLFNGWLMIIILYAKYSFFCYHKSLNVTFRTSFLNTCGTIINIHVHILIYLW